MKNKKEIRILCVDFQEDFSNPKGKCFNQGESIKFVKNIFIPFLRENNLKTHEIMSDYRFTQNKFPRIGDNRLLCNVDDRFGYGSEIPKDVKYDDIWIKSMNSPIWVRENGGVKNKLPGKVFQHPSAFSKWVENNFGKSERIEYILLFGLTLDCCVLCVAQQLCWLGYKVKVLIEGTDPRGDSLEEIRKNKERMVNLHCSLKIWASFISFPEVKKNLNS